MKLTIIGCSGSMSGRESAASSYLVQAVGPDASGLERTWNILLDFGPGAMGQSLKYVDPAMVDAMVFSHMHADHCADIVGMQVYRRWYPEGALPRIPVLSPSDGAARTRGISADDPSETYETEFEFVQVKAGQHAQFGPLLIEFFEAQHTIEALAVRITGPSEADPQRSVVVTYTGDSDTCEGELQASRGADLLLSEAAFEEGRDTVRGVHMTGLRAGELARDAGAGRLVLTHLQPWTKPQVNIDDARSVYSGSVEVAAPGKVYEI